MQSRTFRTTKAIAQVVRITRWIAAQAFRALESVLSASGQEIAHVVRIIGWIAAQALRALESVLGAPSQEKYSNGEISSLYS